MTKQYLPSSKMRVASSISKTRSFLLQRVFQRFESRQRPIMASSNYTGDRQQAAQQKLDAIFAPRQDILKGIKKASGRCSTSPISEDFANELFSDTPGKVALFIEIADFLTAEYGLGQGPASKKRKINSGGSTEVAAPPPGATASTEPVLLEIKELSFSMPQRKKFDVCITQNHFYARAPGTTEPVSGACHAWKDIGNCAIRYGRSPKLTFCRICIFPASTRQSATLLQLPPVPQRHRQSIQIRAYIN